MKTTVNVIFPFQKPLFFFLLMKRPLGSLKPKHIAISKRFLLHHTGFYSAGFAGESRGCMLAIVSKQGLPLSGRLSVTPAEGPRTQRSPELGTRHSCAHWGCACFSWWCKEAQGYVYLCCSRFTSTSLRWFLLSWFTMNCCEVSACFLQKDYSLIGLRFVGLFFFFFPVNHIKRNQQVKW